MSNRNILVGLDVGTTKVCTIVGVHNLNGELEIVGIGTHPSFGLKKGSVVNIEKTVRSIQASLEEAKLMSGVDIKSATIGIAGNHIYSFNSVGAVPIKGKVVTEEDVARVLDAAKAVVIPSDRDVLHVIPQEFRVDNTGGIKDPIGMCGIRLEAHVHIVTGAVSLIQNLVKCVEQTGLQVEQITLQPIASSEAVLTNEEKEMGAILIDIGGGTTDLAIWKEGALIHSQIIPVGGNHFTNDLAVALKISNTEAERIKIHHSSVLLEKINQSAHITVKCVNNARPGEIALSFVAEVLNARATELYEIIKAILDEKLIEYQVNGPIILTGGGALIKGMAELSEYITERPTKIGYPHAFGGMTNIMQHPKYSTVLGLLMESFKKRKDENIPSTKKLEGTDIISKLSESLKSVFKEIF